MQDATITIYLLVTRGVSILLSYPVCVDELLISCKGASMHCVDMQGGRRGSPKCQRYYISLFSKLVNEEGRGSKNLKFLSTYVVYGCPLVGIKKKMHYIEYP